MSEAKKERPKTRGVRAMRLPAASPRTQAAFSVPKRSLSASGPGASNGAGRRRARKKKGNASLVRRIFTPRFFRALFWLVFCSVLGSAAGAGAKVFWSWVMHSSRFAIKELVIRTGPRVSEQDVRMLANLAEGQNILSFRLRPAAEAIEIHPWVKRASVMRELPDRVVIEVRERDPVALMALGSLYYVDHDGEVFKKLLPGEVMDYPVLTGVSLQEVVEDKAGVDPLIQEALAIIGQARHSRSFGSSQISEIHLDRARGATVVRAEDGLRICFGKERIPDKWIRLERTLEEMGDDAAKVAELDLNYEGRATIRLRKGYRVAPTLEAPAGN